MFEVSDFDNVNPRFLLPLREFDIRFSFSEIYLQQEEQIFLRNILAKALRAATAGFADIRPAELSANLKIQSPGDDQLEDREAVYAYGQVSTPVYSFGVQLGRRTLRLYKLNTSFSNLIQSLNVIQQLIGALVPPTVTEGSFADALGLRTQFYASSFAFMYNLALGENLRNRALQVRNTNLIDRLVKRTVPVGQNTSDAPFSGIQFERILRSDANIMGTRTLGSSSREIVVDFECPNNISQKDVNLTVICRSGSDAGSPFELGHIYDFQTPISHFFRDLILGRLMEDAFGDTAVEARLS